MPLTQPHLLHLDNQDEKARFERFDEGHEASRVLYPAFCYLDEAAKLVRLAASAE